MGAAGLSDSPGGALFSLEGSVLTLLACVVCVLSTALIALLVGIWFLYYNLMGTCEELDSLQSQLNKQIEANMNRQSQVLDHLMNKHQPNILISGQWPPGFLDPSEN